MDLKMGGIEATAVELDFALRITFAPAARLTVEGPVLFERDGTTQIVVLGEVDRSGETIFEALLGRVIASAVATATGTLTVSFADGARLVVRPDEMYESWQASAPDGVLYICMPGGEVAVFGLGSPG